MPPSKRSRHLVRLGGHLLASSKAGRCAGADTVDSPSVSFSVESGWGKCSSSMPYMRESPASPSSPACQTTVAAYRHLDNFGWVQLKQNLLEFLQGRRVKVVRRERDSAFVSEKGT